MSVLTQKGMTLPEALIAVALLGVIGVSILPAVQLTSVASQRIDAATDALNTKDSDQQLLTHLLNRMIVTITENPDTQARGSATRFAFTILDSTQQPRTVTLDPLVAGINLKIDSGQEFVLFESLGSVRFSYYGQYNDRQTPQWRHSWESSMPPRMIRLTGTEPLSYEFDIQAQAPLTCPFDPVSRRCRAEG